MKKIVLFLILAVQIAFLPAQDLFFRSKIYTLSDDGANSDTSLTSTYQNGDQLRTESKSSIIVSGEERFIIIDKRSGICGQFSKQELQTDSLDAPLPCRGYQITESNDTKTILGHVCHTATVNLVLQGAGPAQFAACDYLVWYAPDIKTNSDSRWLWPYRKSCFDAISKSLGGLILYSELINKSTSVKTITAVTELSTAPLNSTMFALSGAACTQAKNVKEYKAAINTQQKQNSSRTKRKSTGKR